MNSLSLLWKERGSQQKLVPFDMRRKGLVGLQWVVGGGTTNHFNKRQFRGNSQKVENYCPPTHPPYRWWGWRRGCLGSGSDLDVFARFFLWKCIHRQLFISMAFWNALSAQLSPLRFSVTSHELGQRSPCSRWLCNVLNTRKFTVW